MKLRVAKLKISVFLSVTLQLVTNIELQEALEVVVFWKISTLV